MEYSSTVLDIKIIKFIDTFLAAFARPVISLISLDRLDESTTTGMDIQRKGAVNLCLGILFVYGFGILVMIVGFDIIFFQAILQTRNFIQVSHNQQKNLSKTIFIGTGRMISNVSQGRSQPKSGGPTTGEK